MVVNPRNTPQRTHLRHEGFVHQLAGAVLVTMPTPGVMTATHLRAINSHEVVGCRLEVSCTAAQPQPQDAQQHNHCE